MLLQKSQQVLVVKSKPTGNASYASSLRTVFLTHL